MDLRRVQGKIPSKTTDEWMDAYLNHSRRIVCLLDNDRVVKFGCPSHVFSGGQNIREALRWRQASATPFRGYFAPVFGVHPRGEWLIMERTVRPYIGEHESTEFACLRDAVEKRFGVFDVRQSNIAYLPSQRLVCVDYGADRTTYAPDETWTYCGACIYCKLQQRLHEVADVRT